VGLVIMSGFGFAVLAATAAAVTIAARRARGAPSVSPLPATPPGGGRPPDTADVDVASEAEIWLRQQT
jgi:hypothetical protein